jgi:hypothetical protein
MPCSGLKTFRHGPARQWGSGTSHDMVSNNSNVAATIK